jgi:hypothetical protein
VSGRWWCISEEALLELLRRVELGEDPDAVYAEEWANAEFEPVDPEP